MTGTENKMNIDYKVTKNDLTQDNILSSRTLNSILCIFYFST